MKRLFTIGVCFILLVNNQFAKAQCSAGVISIFQDTVCYGTSISLTVKGSSGDVQWQSATTDTFTHIKGATDSLLKTGPLLQTTYFRVVVSNGSCADTSNELRVFVTIALVDSFTSSSIYDTVTFNSESSKGNIVRYHWDFGNGDTSNMANPIHKYYAVDTSFFVCLTTYDSFGCSNAFCNVVKLYGIGNCYAEFSFYYSGDTVYFYSLSALNGTTFFWDFGDGTRSYEKYPSHVYDTTGTYKACLSISLSNLCNHEGCNEVSVIVNAVKSISANQQPLIVYPNPCADCEIKGLLNPNELLVTDLLGRVVPVSFSKQSNGYQLNFSFAGSGMYLVKNIRTGEVVKLVRE